MIATFADAPIIPTETLRRLWELDTGTARRCAACGAVAGAHAAWVRDGICLDCFAAIRRAHREIQPMAAILLPDRVIRDPTFDLKTRLLGALQLAGGLGAWTPPLSRAELAQTVGASPLAVGRNLAQLAEAGYVKRHPASLPRGGRSWRYYVPAEGSSRRLPPLS